MGEVEFETDRACTVQKGTSTKRQVSKRQVSKRPVSKLCVGVPTMDLYEKAPQSTSG
jgi:hypothetical protein